MLTLSYSQNGMPGALPVSLEEAKSFLRVDGTGHDTLIGLLIEEVTDFVESITQRSFINRPVSALYAGFPCASDALVLPGYPVNEVTEITYIDAEGAEQTLDADVYRLIPGDRGKVLLAYGKNWPAIAFNQYGPVTVTFVAGYGASASSVPQKIKLLLKQVIAAAYEHAEAQTEISLNENMLNRDLFNSIRIPVVG